MDAVLIGHDVATGQPVTIADSDRPRGIYIIGKNGTGKTTFIENLIAHDLSRPGLGLCLLDPHGDLTERILERAVAQDREQNVLLLNMREANFGLNIFECPNPKDASRLAEQAVQVFKKVWGVGEDKSWGPRLEDLLRNASWTLIQNHLTMAQMLKLLTDSAYREQLLLQVTNPIVRDYWILEYPRETNEQREMRASTTNKVRAFLLQENLRIIVSQLHSSIDFRNVMDEGKILLVQLDAEQEEGTSLLGSLIVGRILNAALSRSALSVNNRRRFHLYADEYQRFQTPAFATLLDEARKYNVASVIAHQRRSQLTYGYKEAPLGAASIIVFQVGGEDAEALAKEFDHTPPQPEIIGMKPQLAISQDPIEQLLKRGHVRGESREYIKALRELTKFQQKMEREPLYCEHIIDDTWEPGYRAKPDGYQEGYHAINAYFIALMRGTIRSNTRDEQLALCRIVLRLIDYFLQGWASKSMILTRITDTTEKLWIIDKEVRSHIEGMVEAYVHRKNEASARNALLDVLCKRQMQWEHEVIEGGIASMTASHQRIIECMQKGINPTTNDWYDWYGEEVRAYHHWTGTRFTLAERTAKRKQALIDEQIAWYEKIIVENRRKLESLDATRGERINTVIDSLTSLLAALTALGRLLVDGPIQLETGQFEPIFDRPRTYADVEAEIASRLANLRPYHAHVKFPKGEHTLLMLGPSAIKLTSKSLQILSQLKNQVHLSTTPEEQVDQERTGKVRIRRGTS